MICPVTFDKASKRRRTFLLFFWTLSFFSLSFLLCGGTARAQDAPREIAIDELDRQNATVEKIEGDTPGALLTPADPKVGVDEKYRQRYLAQIMVYAGERPAGILVRYVRRFRVYVPDRDSLPFARKVARTLLTLYTLTHDVLNYDHPRNAPVVNIWITRTTPTELSADTGGEQIRNEIYLYNLGETRKPIEWLREIAHEYGHFILPGISGFALPEEWGNGMLGERLFLSLIADALKAKKLTPDAIPLSSAEEIAEEVALQINPLLLKFAQTGIVEKRMATRDAAQMETFVTFAVYWKSVYGSRALRNAFSESESGQKYAFLKASDFLRGAYRSLKSEAEFTITPPLLSGKAERFQVYLPAGTFRVKPLLSGEKWEVEGVTRLGNTFKLKTAGWHRVTAKTKLTLTK